MISLVEIRAAARRLEGKIHRTPVFPSRTLGERSGTRLRLKCELFQKTGSFKPRGALNKILSLSEAERARGLITVSAGNHAQAVAWAARSAGVPAWVVMPGDAPRTKVEAVREYGAEIVFHDERATLFDRLHREEEARGATFVHPFDDPTVLAGAGTIGLEILEDVPEVDLVLVPVGGGGLLGGVASAIRQTRPRVRVVAVELEEGPGLGPALAAGKPVPVPRPARSLADGMMPPFVGELPLAITREAVAEVVTVTEAEIIEAMKLLVTRCKLAVEGSGAAATAALLARKVKVSPGETVVSLVSGGNVDLTVLSAIAGNPRSG